MAGFNIGEWPSQSPQEPSSKHWEELCIMLPDFKKQHRIYPFKMELYGNISEQCKQAFLLNHTGNSATYYVPEI